MYKLPNTKRFKSLKRRVGLISGPNPQNTPAKNSPLAGVMNLRDNFSQR